MKPNACFWRLFSVLFLLFLATGCISPQRTQPPVSFHLSEIRQISDLRSIRLADDWAGLADYGPTQAHYMLQPKAGGFLGQATFSAGGDFSKEQMTDSAEITIPIRVVQNFLNTLAEATLEDGPYEPYIEHTDDYPDLSIDLVFDGQTVSYQSQSQGGGHVPWAVSIDTQTYVINSGIPMQAWALLSPYLKQDKLQQLEDRVSNSPDLSSGEPLPTTTP